MKVLMVNGKSLVLILTIVLIAFGTQSSYGQTITTSTPEPLTEATLHESIVTLTLTGGTYERWIRRGNVSASGIDGVTFNWWNVDRVSDTKVIIRLEFAGNIDTDATLTFTVEADAIAEYNGNALTATLSVTAIQESLEASTETPLTEANLHGSIITLTLNGQFDHRWEIEDALSISGINGVTVNDVRRVSHTVATVELEFAGNIDTDATLALTVGADAIVGYNKGFTFQFPVAAIEESLEASTETPLIETMLDGSIITLSGLRFVDSVWDIRDAVSVSGIEGVTVSPFGVDRISDTKVTVELSFFGDFDADATLTITVGADAIVGHNQAFTVQLPVTAIEESLVASTEFLLTEANLDGSTITLTLSGVRFVDDSSDIESAMSVSGIDRVYINGSFFSESVKRISDTEVIVELEFDGTDFDTDAMLTFTVRAYAIVGYNQNLTAQIPVTAIQQSNATVSISPVSVISPAIGKELTFTLNIAGGENVAGYQATVVYDDTALSLVDATNGDYLPADLFFLPKDYSREVTLTANTLAKAGNGNGTLATLTFEVEDFKQSTLTLSEVYLVDADGKQWEAATESATVAIPSEPENAILEDINRDGVVNIQDLVIVSTRFGQWGRNSADINGDGLVDIVDLVLVASAVNAAAAAPSLNPQALERLTTGDVHGWLSQARQLTLTDPAYLRGIIVLEQLLKTLTPKKTTLLPNYPNPFNPETWIPYHLSNDVDVHIEIYNTKGVLVRRLDLEYQMAGYYTDRTKAAYWDGKNKFGEQVASGVYFYHLSAGDYSATRKMLIRK